MIAGHDSNVLAARPTAAPVAATILISRPVLVLRDERSGRGIRQVDAIDLLVGDVVDRDCENERCDEGNEHLREQHAVVGVARLRQADRGEQGDEDHDCGPRQDDE